jgi:hypothetical protein
LINDLVQGIVLQQQSISLHSLRADAAAPTSDVRRPPHFTVEMKHFFSSKPDPRQLQLT